MSSTRNMKRSEIWLHFSEYAPHKAKCCYCGDIISVSGGSTGNLTRHMKRKHCMIPLNRSRGPLAMETMSTNTNDDNEVAEDVPSTSVTSLVPQFFASATTPMLTKVATTAQKSQPSMREFVHRPLPLKKTKELDKQLLTVIVKEYQPFSIVEDNEFRKFVKMLNPGYNLPSRKTLSNSLMPRFYNEIRDRVKAELNAVTAVCLTTDGWTSVNTDSFIGVTAHFIDGSSKLCSYLLGLIEYNERHTAENLRDMLLELTREWGINNKITAVTTDNAQNQIKFIRLCNWRRIPCFAHTINLIVQHGINAMGLSLISKVKAIVEYFKRSTSAHSKLQEMQQQMNSPVLKLKQDVSTRWNSTYDMLSRILKVKEPVIATLALVNR